MGNCQAAEAATVVIHHPDGKVERAYWSLSATEVMAANPGHYVAAVIDVARPPPPPRSIVAPTNSSCSYRGSGGGGGASSATVKHLKLLRPDDTLRIGHVYRLVSFEEVLREFASKRHVKLSRLLSKQEKTKTSRPRRESRSGGNGDDSRSDRRHSRRQSGSGGGQARDPEPVSSPATAAAMTREKKEEEEEEEAAELEEVVRGMMGMGRRTAGLMTSFDGGAAPPRRQRQWRPALQSIAEVGS